MKGTDRGNRAVATSFVPVWDSSGSSSLEPKSKPAAAPVVAEVASEEEARRACRK